MTANAIIRIALYVGGMLIAVGFTLAPGRLIHSWVFSLATRDVVELRLARNYIDCLPPSVSCLEFWQLLLPVLRFGEVMGQRICHGTLLEAVFWR